MKLFFYAAVLVLSAVIIMGPGSSALAAQGKKGDPLRDNAVRMIEEGKKIFRFDTFGSEAFWGDTLQLHKAVAGEKNGGVEGGVSPKTALAAD